MELIPPMELAPNLNGIKHQIELELELRPKYHQNPSPDSDQALELKHHYGGGVEMSHSDNCAINCASEDTRNSPQFNQTKFCAQWLRATAFIVKMMQFLHASGEGYRIF